MEQVTSTQRVFLSKDLHQPLGAYIVVCISFIWLGFFSTISFMEAPVKFHAPHLSLSTGVEVGRIVFHTSQLLQWIFCVCLLFSMWRAGSLFNRLWKWCGALVAIMLLESFWLFPVLDRQAQQVIEGHVLPMTAIHWIFVLFEFIKIPCLFLIGWRTLKGFSISHTFMVSH
jgi:hypothetical protein